MPRELVTIQVGQCGNQIGYKFWELLLSEHSKNNKSGQYDEALSSFFRNVDRDSSLPIGSEITDLKARAVVVDMEEGVTNQLLKSEIGEIFDQRNFINDVSGAGNNWAHGFHEYGTKYASLLVENIGSQVEKCDSIQSFFLIHSLGGGTGSGLGSYILGLLEDHFPEVFRFTASVFPSENDDVVTSPYNALFSLYEIMKHADCSLPIDNQALIGIVETVEEMANKLKGHGREVVKGSELTGEEKNPRRKAYDKMNSIVANLLSNLTCSMRFEGILNVDFNEITMNLVPYPDIHFLLSSLAPLYSVADPRLQPRKFDEIFNDILDEKYQLIKSRPCSNTYLAMGLILRGKVSFSDVNRNIKMLREKKNLNFVHWNTEGFKYGICNTAPVHQDYSLLCLANNTCVREKIAKMRDKFNLMYKRKVNTHHYT
jgi:tubulin epsilon